MRTASRAVRRCTRSWIAFLIALGCVATLPGAAHAAAYAQIEGTGSTWSELIVQQWISDVDANGMKVVYTGGGSSKGRKDFSQDSTDFAISEIPYQGVDEAGNADTSGGREFAYLPIVAGGTAFTYQLKVGNELVRNLRLSGETLAKIFTNQITNWNDPAIAKDNNGRAFPSLPITPVVRSDGSGTTAQFTTWMDHEYPSIWRPFFGRSGLTSYYPRKGRAVGQAGSDQVMNTIAGFAGNGTIGYVEYSYPVNKDYPVVKVLNKGGYFVEPTQYNVAVALTKAKINQDKGSALYLTQVLDGVYTATDPRAYPLSSYSYMIIPTGKSDPRMSTAKRQTLADFLYYSLCAGQAKAGPYGYSPLPLNLVQAGFQQIAQLKQADSAVDLTDRDVTSCNNPTFDGKNLSGNKLAQIAPQPAACDKVGAGPCGTATGTGTPSTDEGTGAAGGQGGGTGTAAGGGTGGGGAAGGGAAGVPGGDAAPVIDPETGAVVGGGDVVATGGEAIYANPTELAADRAADTRAFGWLAAVELVALVLLPGLYVASLKRRRSVR
ncbi:MULTISPECIES: phosphate ABC transporter substrate-binding protein PstS [unclassified Nocardioides]|uniref:phosphate ABC transporter substrate-binding protein PstS n=1 Tax=unclassified Nocardioides TaxID=2615069 RepID=UPI00266563CD|nr:phosphate ABC transporter substrate-binding protein PstS [Nocardioides sp. Arc9.136]WKN48715.1 phosphate ABC transporter substrate-binding protein PstS [Nocardioides sp. Arc9.136]